MKVSSSVSNVVYRFASSLKGMIGERLSKVILYGSYARGDYHEHSDVDIMILVKMSPEEARKLEEMVYDLAFDYEMETGIDISPIVKSEEQYEYWVDDLPFYRNIKNEGIEIHE